MFHHRATIAAMTVLLLLSLPCFAGKYNTKLSIGDAAPVFKDLEGVDGKKYSLDDFKDKDIVVIAIMCNTCPIVRDYEDRIKAFVKKYASDPKSKVAFVAINVSKDDEDSLPNMKERAKKQGFTFPYVIDPSQKIGRDLGAVVTPEFFVLNRNRKVAYMGKMDDSFDEPKTNYLEAAVDALLKGESPSTKETRPLGCAVEYAKERSSGSGR